MISKKPLLLRILFVFFFTICAGFLGGFLSKYFVSKDAGLAGGAIVLFYVLIGLVIGLILAFFIMRIIRPQLFKYITGIVSTLGVLGLVLFGLRMSETQKERDAQRAASEEFYQTHKPTAPEANSSTAEDPIGMGVITLKTGVSKLDLYKSDNIEQLDTPYDKIVIDLNNSVQPIIQIPGNVKPRHIKLDYQIFYMTAVKQSGPFIEVIGNEDEGSTCWIKSNQVKLLTWPEFLLSVFSVESKYPQDYLVREEPMNHSTPINHVTSDHILRPVKVQGEWILVEIMNSGLESEGKGWIRWRTQEELLIDYNLLS